MYSKYLKFLILFLFGIALLSSQANAEGKEKEKKLSKTQGLPNRTYLNINNISTQIYNDGNSDIKPDGNSGVIYPKGSGKGAVFESGFVWGALISGDPQPRIGGSTYSQGLQGGKILSPGVAESPDLDKNRIYRVRPDIYPGGPDVDLSLAAIDEATSASAIRNQYETDWTEWPVADGAPFNDVDSNGTWDPNVDVPGVPGADQTIWFVANDLDANKTRDLYGADPLGIEMQATLWAYAQAGALGNMFFRKYIIINKSNEVFNNMYVAMWSDVDLGNSTDDYSGCDTTLSLGFTYNANAVDATYDPLTPPAVGFDFFQGPIVPGEPTDTAIFKSKFVPGMKNLPMTAFIYYARGDATVTDPQLGAIEGSTQWYNFMQGRVGKTGEPFRTPPELGNQPTTYVLTGDPVAGTGWLDGQQLPAGDRRQASVSGPFNMAPGDTQEVVVAEIVAGATGGVSNIDAVGLLKTFDQKAQEAYDNFFILPSPPPKPNVQVAELNQELILNWGWSSLDVAATEGFGFKGFAFEGYNVYQLPAAGATIDQARRLATFDLTSDPATVLGPVVDPTSGATIVVPQQYGNNGGIQRYFRVTKDYIKNSPLVNGNRYYFAVTAYAFSPDSLAVPNNLENPLSIITAVPHSPNPGTRYNNAYADTVQGVTHEGPGDGSVVPIVVDPSSLNGHTYRVNFIETDGEYTYNITDETINQLIASGLSNQADNGEHAIVDGILVKVLGPPPGMKDFDFTGIRTITFAGTGDGGNWGSEGYSGAIGNGFDNWFSGSTVTYDKLTNVELRFADADTLGNFDINQENVSFGYRYMRGATGDPARPEFAQYILNPSAGYAFQEFSKNVPLAAYNLETTPPTRLAVGFLENNAINAVLDGKYFPINHDAPISDNIAATGPREWLYIFSVPYSETPDPALEVDILNETLPIMWFLTVNRRFNVPFVNDDTFTILSNHISTPADVFTFTAPAVVGDMELAKEDVNRVNVYPNPYYGVNSEEINKYNRFVTFTHLPAKATIRLFNLAGVLVKTVQKDDLSQFARWDLSNESGLPVASGLYIAHIDMPELGVTKILKLAIIQEQQILDRF
jgi:hypothetical protein